MSTLAIRTVGLGKRYYTGRRVEPYKTIRDALTGALASPVRRARRLVGGRPADRAGGREPFWALKDLSLEVRHGEIVGIIGRNGAGKSTLLKILSRITEPTTGFADMHGRVGALLEVGTGFHPELTGRENVFLNGAILGMSREHITRRFDEIVAFAEIETFLDTPVKHYSSGMYMRLAFAVAAHLEPEILVVDEVLAVGDAAFQKKCLNKMQNVRLEGRTVLFVSHNMSAVSRLCGRVVWLDRGTVRDDGAPSSVIARYLNSDGGTASAREWSDPRTAPAGEAARLLAVRLAGAGPGDADVIDVRRAVSVEMEYEVLQDGHVLLPSIHLFNDDGVHVFSAVDVDPAWRGRRRPRGTYASTALIPGNLLNEGTLSVAFGLTTLNPPVLQFFERDLLTFCVVESGDRNTARGDWPGAFRGAVRPLLTWSTRFRPADDSSPLP
jgi:lipopolysaccharide transport system ATP-binding protein